MNDGRGCEAENDWVAVADVTGTVGKFDVGTTDDVAGNVSGGVEGAAKSDNAVDEVVGDSEDDVAVSVLSFLRLILRSFARSIS